MQKEEKITITLPPDIMEDIQKQVQAGFYGSTSELIHEAMRLWQKQKEERNERISLIRTRLERSAQSGDPVPLGKAFEKIETLHRQRMNRTNNETL